MVQVQTGQCGLCAHFGEKSPQDQQLIQIRSKRQAPESYVNTCGLPSHAALDLKVTPISGCAAFEAAKS